MAVNINGLTGLTFNNGSTQDVGGIGTGSQTWQNVTASRAGGVTYTNTTGRPIMVNIGENTNSAATLLVDGVQVAQSSIVGGDATMSAIVPAGSTYSATFGGLVFWSELR